MELRGDLKWHKFFMTLKPSWAAVNICHVCVAQSRGPRSILACKLYMRKDRQDITRTRGLCI